MSMKEGNFHLVPRLYNIMWVIVNRSPNVSPNALPSVTVLVKYPFVTHVIKGQQCATYATSCDTNTGTGIYTCFPFSCPCVLLSSSTMDMSEGLGSTYLWSSTVATEPFLSSTFWCSCMLIVLDWKAKHLLSRPEYLITITKICTRGCSSWTQVSAFCAIVITSTLINSYSSILNVLLLQSWMHSIGGTSAHCAVCYKVKHLPF